MYIWYFDTSISFQATVLGQVEETAFTGHLKERKLPCGQPTPVPPPPPPHPFWGFAKTMQKAE